MEWGNYRIICYSNLLIHWLGATTKLGKHLGTFREEDKLVRWPFGTAARWGNLTTSALFYPDLQEIYRIFSRKPIWWLLQLIIRWMIPMTNARGTQWPFAVFTTPRMNHTKGMCSRCFSAVPIGIWIGSMISFCLFVALLTVGTHLLRCPYPSLWTIISAFLEQYSFPFGSRFVTIVSLLTATSLFFILNYGKNTMRTELVVVDEPIVVRTYDDIIERKI